MSQKTENQNQVSEDLFATQDLLGTPALTEEIAEKNSNDVQMSLDFDIEPSEAIEQQSQDIFGSENTHGTEAEIAVSAPLGEVQMSLDFDVEQTEKDDETGGGEEIGVGAETEDIEGEETEDIEEETEDVEEEMTEDIEQEITEEADDEVVEDSEAVDGEIDGEAQKKKPAAKSSSQQRITELPLSKVKHIIKLDPDVNLVNSEAVFLITKATEFFVKTLAKESFNHAAQQKKKTITKAHVDQALTMLSIEMM